MGKQLTGLPGEVAGGLYGLFPYRERLSGLIDRETEQ
jgi:hypothetical protein